MFERRKLSFKSSGFTLIELLIAMALASIMMAVIASAYWVQAQTSREQQMVVEMQQNARAAIYLLERDIKMAGYDGNPNDADDMTITLAQIDANGNQELEFTFTADDDDFDNDGSGVKDEPGETETIHYRLYDFSGDVDTELDDLQRQAGEAPIAQNIESLEFFYTMADGSRTLTPADPANIRAVGISLLARTASPTRERDNSTTYTSLSGDVRGPFNDGFKRQFITAMVRCRNMGN